MSRWIGERFERDIVAKGEPAVFRGLVADWPVVRPRAGPDLRSLAQLLREAATNEPFEAWFGPPEIEGRFGYNEDFSGFNSRATAGDGRSAARPVAAPVRARQRPYSMYASGIPIRKYLPRLVPTIPVPMLEHRTRETLISLWLGNRTRTAAHWDLPQNLACVVAGRRRFTLFPTDQLEEPLRRPARVHAGRATDQPGRSRRSRL